MVANDRLKDLLAFRSELLGFIRAILRNTADAEDLFQETCRIILEKSDQTGPIVDFRAWAKEIARRQVLQHYRTLRTRKQAVEQHPEPSPERQLVADRLRELERLVQGDCRPSRRHPPVLPSPRQAPGAPAVRPQSFGNGGTR